MTEKLNNTIPIGNKPKTVDEAVERLISELSLRDKVKIAKMDRENSLYLHKTLGSHIRQEFGLWSGNIELLESCRLLTGQDQCHVDRASAMIIDALWARLKRTHAVRAVK